MKITLKQILTGLPGELETKIEVKNEYSAFDVIVRGSLLADHLSKIFSNIMQLDEHYDFRYVTAINTDHKGPCLSFRFSKYQPSL